MKKIALLLALALALSCCLLMLAACGGEEDTSSAGTSSSAASSDATSSKEESSAATSSDVTSSKEETSEPETSEPETSEPETSGPESSEPETSEPETSEPETSEPETSEPSGNDNPDNSNLALGKSYVTSQLYQQGGAESNWGWSDSAPIAYPDDGGELTDGVFPPDDASYDDPAFMGFARGGDDITTPDYKVNGYSFVTVDLGDVYKLSRLVAYFATTKVGGGVNVPAGVEFWVSDDGTNFTSVGSVVPQNDESVSNTPVSLDCNVSGRYVQVRMTSSGWMHICEFEAY